jgi:glycosyltransferase involved in cell wall biosynthesis
MSPAARAEPTRASKKPKLLELVTLAEVGGAQTCVQWLVPALVSRFDVVVAAHGPGPLAATATDAGARFIPLQHVRRAIHPLHDLLGLVELIVVVRRERPAIIHAHSSKAGILGRLAARLARVPVVFTAHGWAFKSETGWRSRLYRTADRSLAPLTNKVVCVSEAEARIGLAAGTCLAERTVVIRNPAPPVATPPGNDPRPSRVPLIVSVGRLKRPKDFATLVLAVARLKRLPFRLQIVGDGPDRDEIRAAVAAAGLEDRVELLGERHDVPELLAEADVFVLSSRSEGLPIALLEAMAHGLPVVASDVGGISEALVHGDSGLLVPPADPAALADALGALLTDAELRERLGMSARIRCETSFELEGWREAHLRLYESLLADR